MRRLYVNDREGEEIMYQNLTSEQLFFISYSATCCDKNNDKENQILGTSEKYYFASSNKFNSPPVSSSYSSKDVRLKVTLSNYKPFAKAFNCKIGTKMNTKDKCEFWR